MNTLRQFQSFGRPTQILLINQLTINIGFYMLIPYLAGYLADELQLAAAAIGLVLGIRSFSQQGLFLIGGSLGDRIGYKPVIIMGCALRTIGFGLFGVVDSLFGLLVASALSGFAGALFNPAVRAYLAHAERDRRAEAFALFNVFAETGTLIGPLVGILLLSGSFQMVCLIASALFVVLTVLQMRYLPQGAAIPQPANRPVLHDWREALSNRTFVAFALGMVGYFMLYNQMYLGLPLEVQRLTGSDANVGLLFTVSAVLSITAQVRITAYCKARWGATRSIMLGLGLMGFAFLPLLVLTPWLPTLSPAEASPWLQAAIHLSPILLSTVLLTMGSLIAQPFAMEMIPLLGGERMIGTYFGLYYLASGVGAALGNTASGALFDLSGAWGWPAAPWLLMMAVGLISALCIATLNRRGRLIQSSVAGGD